MKSESELNDILNNYRKNKNTKINNIKKQKEKMTILLTNEETRELNKNIKPNDKVSYEKIVHTYFIGNKIYKVKRTYTIPKKISNN